MAENVRLQMDLRFTLERWALGANLPDDDFPVDPNQQYPAVDATTVADPPPRVVFGSDEWGGDSSTGWWARVAVQTENRADATLGGTRRNLRGAVLIQLFGAIDKPLYGLDYIGRVLLAHYERRPRRRPIMLHPMPNVLLTETLGAPVSMLPNFPAEPPSAVMLTGTYRDVGFDPARTPYYLSVVRIPFVLQEVS